MALKVKLVFDDWRKRGKSVYQSEKGVELSKDSFHSGTTFDGEISLNGEDAEKLYEAINKGFQPVFWVSI